MKLPFWATALTIFGVIVLCGLGFWQIERLQWKTSILNLVEAEYAVEASQRSFLFSDLSGEVNFKRGFLTGLYLHEKEILIQARTNKGVPGYHLLTPFQIFDQSGSVILVNRGWVPIDQKMPKNGVIERPLGMVKITGMLRTPSKDNMFVPKNQPEIDAWYRVDLKQIAQVKGVVGGMVSNMLYVEAEEGRSEFEDARFPISAATQVKINNNHAQYALFWFTMAVLLVVIYVIRFIFPQKCNSHNL